MTYSEKLRDPRWQKRRLQLFEAANWTCESCGTKTETLHAHHGYYKRKTEPWDYPDYTMHVLCESCHGEMQALLESTHHFIGCYSKQELRSLNHILDTMRHSHTEDGRLDKTHTLRVLLELILHADTIGLWPNPLTEEYPDWDWVLRLCLDAAMHSSHEQGWKRGVEIGKKMANEPAEVQAEAAL